MIERILSLTQPDPHFATLWRNSREAVNYNLVVEPDIKWTDDFLKRFYKQQSDEQFRDQPELFLSAILLDEKYRTQKGCRTFAVLRTLERKLKFQYCTTNFAHVHHDEQIVTGTREDDLRMFFWPAFPDWLMVHLGCELMLEKDEIARRMEMVVADHENMFVGNDFCIQREMVPEYIKTSAGKVVKLLDQCYNLKER